MDASNEPLSSYARKIQLIMDSSLRRFNGNFTKEQYDLELQVAHNILTNLGVRP